MARVTLRILDGADRGRVFDSLPTPVTIGREEGNAIQLNDERVSRFHLKIQEDREKVVLTDLESTNGTKVNGEDVHLRILRHGDLIAMGRSVLLFGSEEEIARRLGKPIDPDAPGTLDSAEEAARERGELSSQDFELRLEQSQDPSGTAGPPQPPELPERLSPAQAAQLAELLEYIHVRLRGLLATVAVDEVHDEVTLDQQQWQNLLDLQARLATYLRRIGEPDELP